MSRSIGFVSGKGGVGKTTLTANLSVAIADLGGTPAAVDTNVRASSLGFHLGFYEEFPTTLRDVCNGTSRIGEAVFTHPHKSLKYIPAPMEDTRIRLNGIEDVFNDLKERYYIVLADLAPAFSDEALETIQALDEVIVVSTPTLPAIADAMRTIKTARENDTVVTGIVLNQVRGNDAEMGAAEVEESCDVPVLASIPYDDNVQQAETDGIPVVSRYPITSASRHIKQLAADLMDEDWEPPGFFTRIKYRLLGSPDADRFGDTREDHTAIQASNNGHEQTRETGEIADQQRSELSKHSSEASSPQTEQQQQGLKAEEGRGSSSEHTRQTDSQTQADGNNRQDTTIKECPHCEETFRTEAAYHLHQNIHNE